MKNYVNGYAAPLHSIEVLVNGRPVKEYQQYINGEYKTFIEGRAGTEYSLRINNHSGQKLLAIAAVDSINVVGGHVSDGYKGRGYIIQPYGSVTIKGYRESDNTVGAFMFTNKENSYASEKGFEKNCGIIAVNLIDEKPEPIKQIINEIHHHHHHDHYPEPIKPYIAPKPWSPWEPYWGTLTCSDTGNATYKCSNSAGSQTQDFMASEIPIVANSINVSQKTNFDLGTSWGQKVEDKITRKSFKKNNIVASFKIYYASRHALESMGVQFYPEKQIDNNWPQGFENEYCKPPKGWN